MNRKTALARAAELGAPSGALRLPGTNYVYMAMTTDPVIRIARWTPSGKLITVEPPVVDFRFTYMGVEYHIDPLSLHPYIGRPPEGAKRADAMRFHLLTDVDCGYRNVLAESQARYYLRRTRAEVLRKLPDFEILPGDTPAGYKVEGNTVHFGNYQGRVKVHPIENGSVTFKGVSYDVIGQRLYRTGFAEDMFTLSRAEQRLIFDELRPHWKLTLPYELVWYELELGEVPAVVFHWYDYRTEKQDRKTIKQSCVSFRGNTYKINSEGELQLVI